MHSDRSEYGHRRQHGDRGTRQWDDYNGRWEEKREPHRDITWDSYHKYSGDGHSSSERTSRRRRREYSDSPTMLHSTDSLNRERSRKSPVRRRMSSPDWSVSEKKRRSFTEDDKDNYRYRGEPEDKMYRQSPDSFSHAHVPKDFKHTLPQEEDFKDRKTLQDSRNRHQQEEFTYKQQHDDLTYRRSSGYYKDGQEKSQGHSQDRTQSHDHSMMSYAKPGETNDSPSTDYDYHQNGRFPLNESIGQSFEHDVTHQSPAVPEEKKSTNGFQRFLDVLNKGVNVDVLTKIVTQAQTEVEDRPCSPASMLSAVDRPWSPSCSGGQQGGQQYTQNWSESKESHRWVSPQQHHRSFSPKGASSLSDEKPLQRSDGGRSYFSSNSSSRSPSVVEKITMTPDDKHRHMQDVLQAIGMDLGLEELGQMSHRIQERLYGKKDSDWGRHRKGSRERETRPAFSPKRKSRSSSSSRSSFSPLTRDYCLKKDLYSAQSDVTKMHQAVEYAQKSSSSSLQDNEKCKTHLVERTFAPPTPVTPTYSPVNYSPLLYPALPPYSPHAGPASLWSPLPPFLPHPCYPPLNILPTVLSQTRQLLPQHLSNQQQPYCNLPGVNPVQPLNTTQKSKTLSRRRCLQVIETKQPG
ncbi:hypothetical protein PAMA_015859 [Pampus argenteus]